MQPFAAQGMKMANGDGFHVWEFLQNGQPSRGIARSGSRGPSFAQRCRQKISPAGQNRGFVRRQPAGAQRVKNPDQFADTMRLHKIVPGARGFCALDVGVIRG